MVTKSRESILEELRALKAGLEKNVPGEALVYKGRKYTGPGLVARIDELLDAAQTVAVARGALAGALADEQRLQADTDGLLKALRHVVRLKYGNDLPTLAEFAIEPKKARTRPTTEQKLAMGAKIRATRKKRRTSSKKQKKAIHGDVTGVAITPLTKKE